jgi:hypothetical protein
VRTVDNLPIVTMRSVLTSEQVDYLTERAIEAWVWNEHWPKDKPIKVRLRDVVISVLAQLDEALCK